MSYLDNPMQPRGQQPWVWFLMGGFFWFPMIASTVITIYDISMLGADEGSLMVQRAFINLLIVLGGMLGTRLMIRYTRTHTYDVPEVFLANSGIVFLYWMFVLVLGNIWISRIVYGIF